MSNKVFGQLQDGPVFNQDGSGRMFQAFAYLLARPDGTYLLDGSGMPIALTAYGPFGYGSTLHQLRSDAENDFVTTRGPAAGLSGSDLTGLQFVYLDDKGLL